MAKLTMLSGLPASGKSTKAKELVENGNTVRVNRDLLREMLHFSEWSGKNEELVVSIEKSIADVAIKKGLNVVVDDCNLNPKNKSLWLQLCSDNKCTFFHEKIDTPWRYCALRDSKREKSVGAIVIANMAIQYGIIKFENDGVVICDLDGTICDITHRLQYVKQVPKDWKSFFGGILHDTVRENVRNMLIDFKNQGKTIVFVSARPDTYRKETLLWLERNLLEFGFTLIMRKSGDKRKDTEVKKQILDTYFPDKSVIHRVIDDRPSVIRMWKESGLEVIDVGDGIEF